MYLEAFYKSGASLYKCGASYHATLTRGPKRVYLEALYKCGASSPVHRQYCLPHTHTEKRERERERERE